MFKYCLWYKITDNHMVNNIINELSFILTTERYPGHLTIKAKMDHLDSIKLYNQIKFDKEPYFELIGSVYQTKNDNFYALQQDYLFNGKESNRNYHVSLVYRLNKGFTKEEIELVNNMVNDKKEILGIKNNEIKKELFNCSNINCKYWKKVKL